jgi:hypothetical protein
MSFVLYGGGDGGPVTIECSTADNDCPDGEKCMPWANDGGSEWNASRCAPLAPDPGAIGDACSFEGSQWSSVDDCETGAICVGNGEVGAGRCIELCAGGCDTPGTVCIGEDPFGMCFVPCDPFAPVCAVDEVCVGFGAGTYCMPALPPLAGYGEECTGAHSCESGLFCSATALPTCGNTCCTALCDVTQPDACPEAAGGIVCTDARWPPPFENIGTCHQ